MAKQMTSIDTSIETTDDGNKQKPKLYAKDSMDRYGDDLCQLMLSHLSFKDCFRYESVSKQFRRTVFGNVVDITITDKFIQQLLNDETNGTQLLATIAIKCANIETIDCRGISNRYEEHIPEVLDIFRDNCVHLQDIHCNLLPKSGQLLAEFGPLVTIGNIVGIGPPYNIVYFRDYAAVNVCHRLSHLRLKCSLHDVFDTNSDIRFVKSVRKLELHSDYTVIVDNDRWSAFVAHNQCLQSLAVKSYWFLAAKELTKWGRQVSRLAQLRQLTVGMVLGIPGDVPDSSVVP
ncbi:unnamed protein product [Medioppia subpectinata]|uniref:F-box domain-containing protein n=1 Tax=Medioppia subpectinata TaxID=1979941 RepID=A0A7R9KFP9_9ACAR|nr:unnamed protein product [Medioppia subpectinata]CAG2102517.1 unnamed protein product [Medioppia subpectinata]